MRFIDLRLFWHRYKKNRAAVVGLMFILFIMLIALLTPFVSPYPARKTGVGNSFEVPSIAHYFGTDQLGRDLFSDVLWGAQTSLMVGFLVAMASALIGTIIGAFSGYYGGIVDDVLMRITEVFLIIPVFLLALIIVALFGSNIFNIILALVAVSWPGTTKLIRAEIISLKEKEFVEAAKAIGLRETRIIFEEILPNAFFPVIVNATFQVGSAILMEAGLSFLGLGDPSKASWGILLYNAQFFFRRAWWMVVFPGFAMFLTALSLNLLGDGLNDALNPRLKER